MAQIRITLSFAVICSNCGGKLDAEIKQEFIEDAKYIEVKPCPSCIKDAVDRIGNGV